MAKENVSLDSRVKKKDETRNYVLEELKHDLISEKHKISSFNFCICFDSWCSCSSCIVSSVVGIKICAKNE